MGRDIFHHNSGDKSSLSGEVEMDETYLSGKRQGQRGRGSYNKIPCFGMIESDGKIIVEVIPKVSSSVLRKIVKEKVKKGFKVYLDRIRAKRRRRTMRRIKEDNQILLRIQTIELNHPFWGYRRIWAYMKYRLNQTVNRKRIYRIMKEDNLLVYPNLGLLRLSVIIN